MIDLGTIWTLAGCAGVGAYGFGLILNGGTVEAYGSSGTARLVAGGLIIALAVGVALMIGVA